MELILEHSEGIEKLSESTLVVALDDTGHEEFKDKKHLVFGLGGCAFMVRDYQRLIEKPWNFLCDKYLPEIERPIHASENLRTLNKEQIDSINYFFEHFQFFRIATTVSSNTITEIEEDFIQIVGASLFQRILDIAKWTDFNRLFILIEESQRIELRIIQSLSNNKIEKENGEIINVEFGLIPKSSCLEAMEVADLIIHTAGRQTRERNKGNEKFQLDFEKVFQSVDEKLTSFFEITKVKENN